MGLSLHKFATDAAGVLVANLVDLDGVVSAVEGDKELAVLIIGLSGDELGVEAQDVHVVFEHLLHVLLRRLGLKLDHRSHGVLLVSESVVGRHSGVLDVAGSSRQLHGLLNHTQVLLVPSLGVVVTAEDLAVTAVDVDGLTATDVLGHVVLFLTKGHAWAVGEDWGLGELLALQKLGEGSTATVSCVDLLYLYGVVAQEEVQLVELFAAVVAVVLPQDVEAEDIAVVLKELLETTVRATTLQLDLNVVLEFGLIRGSLLHVDHGAGLRVLVIRVALRGANVAALVREVAAGEVVAVNDTEHAAVHVNVHAETEVTPVVVARAVGLGELGTLQEDALGDARVGHTRLNDVEGVVIEVEVDDASADAEVLVGVLHDGLQEVGLEVQHLLSTRVKRKG